MVRGGRWLVGAAIMGAFGALAGCGGRYLMAQREPWRHEAEVKCLASGAVQEGPTRVRIRPIEGPGACGIDFPLKASTLGSSVPLGYLDEPRPPAPIPMPATPWPITPPAAAPGAAEQPPGPDRDIDRSGPMAPGRRARPGPEPSSLGRLREQDASPEPYDFRRPYGAAPAPRAPAMTSAGPVGVSPPATLACPLISVLDRWVDEAVQPAAMKWFAEPVVEIQQISAYSCRGMNGDANATISEHAFGNALDVAAFVLADGRKVTVQYGWRGAPQEQAFLHDVQAAACEQFTTVLAPGANIFHYNHIHVDLMRRESGHRACNPSPISGEAAAARLGFHLSMRRPQGR